MIAQQLCAEIKRNKLRKFDFFIFFANYVTLNLLASKSPFIDDGNMPVVLIDVL